MDYTNRELQIFEEITDNIILGIFDRTKDKRYWIERAVKQAYNLGKDANYTEGETDA